jgi:hypothetical protein
MAPTRIAAILAVLLSATPVAGADPAYCILYSREMMRAYVRAQSAAAAANLTIDSMQFMLTKLETRCLNLDDDPVIKDLPSDGQWLADVWSQIQRNIPKPALSTSAPLAAEPAKPPSPPPSAPSRVSPKVAAAAPTTGNPQPLCLKYNRRTIYLNNGHSWRCVQ